MRVSDNSQAMAALRCPLNTWFEGLRRKSPALSRNCCRRFCSHCFKDSSILTHRARSEALAAAQETSILGHYAVLTDITGGSKDSPAYTSRTKQSRNSKKYLILNMEVLRSSDT